MCEKYKDAIYMHAYWRQKLLDIKELIINASYAQGSIYTCTNQEKTPGWIDLCTCVERLWSRNTEQRRIDEEAFCPDETTEVLPDVELCQACKEVQRLIDERKAVKRKLATAKRRITLLGKGLL